MEINLNEDTSVAVAFSAFFLVAGCAAMFGCHQVEETSREKERTNQEALKAGLVQKQATGNSSLIWTQPEHP